MINALSPIQLRSRIGTEPPPNCRRSLLRPEPPFGVVQDGVCLPTTKQTSIYSTINLTRNLLLCLTYPRKPGDLQTSHLSQSQSQSQSLSKARCAYHSKAGSDQRPHPIELSHTSSDRCGVKQSPRPASSFPSINRTEQDIRACKYCTTFLKLISTSTDRS